MGSYQKTNPKYSKFTNIDFFLCMYRLWCKKRKEKKKVKILYFLYQSLDPTTHALIKNFPDLPRTFWRFEAKPLKTPHPFIWFKSLAKYSYPDFSKDENWKKKTTKAANWTKPNNLPGGVLLRRSRRRGRHVNIM